MTKPKASVLSRLMEPRPPTSRPRTLARIVLGVFLVSAGVSHLTFAREEFSAQVPQSLPLNTDFVVVSSGIVEIALGSALAVMPTKRVPVGWVVALFFVAVFPGNIAQWLNARDGFGLDTDTKRALRLLFQPALVCVAMWSTGAWRDRPRAAKH